VPRLRPNSALLRRALPLLLLILAAGCERTLTIRGIVTDTAGDTLPGVAVIAAGMGAETLTTARGDYVLLCPLQTTRIDFAKTGYTTGHASLDPAAPHEQELPAITLWGLPASRGLYQVVNHRYYEATRSEPRPYLGKNNAKLSATKKVPELIIADSNPRMIAFRLPSYDVACARLGWVDAAQPGSDAGVFPEKVLTGIEPVQVLATPIDEPERQLIELKFTMPLVPGIYAIHWGALDGYTTTDRNIFLFGIRDPNVPEDPTLFAPPPADAPAPADAEKADDAEEEEEEEEPADPEEDTTGF
jgi:hypothetical protein